MPTALAGCGATSRRAPETSAAAKTALPASLRTRPLVFVAGGRHSDHLFVARPDGSHTRQLERDKGCKQRPLWSPDGRRIAFRFMPACDYTRDQVVLIDADGRNRFNLSRKIGVFGTSPSWSPDGVSIAFAGSRVRGGRPDPKDQPLGIYVAAADGSRHRRITPRSLGEVQYPMWSPYGRTIAFQVSRREGFELYTVAADGSGLERLTHGEGYTEWPMWSPDGQQIAYGVEGQTSALWVMQADGTRKHVLRRGLGVPANWAPGEWLVANCNLGRTGRIGVCAISPDGSARLTLLRGRDAGFAAWHP